MRRGRIGSEAIVTRSRPRTNTEWIVDLGSTETRAEALVDLREYLARAVYVYLDRRRDDLSYLDRTELAQMAEDFVQDALLRILDKLDTFEGRSKFTTWAYRFVINVAAAELRLHRWRTLSMEAVVSEDEEVSLLLFLSDQEAPDPETRAVRREILDLMQQVIEEELSRRQRFALVSNKLRGMPVEEVARQLDTTPNSVYKLIYDARRKLKEGLEARHYSLADILAIFGDMGASKL
jgi:RNA polymerase sigma-70 factor (ECF subfamily)